MSRARDLGGSITGNPISKNLIHNGNFLINQRDFSSYEVGNLASEPASIWVADRWRTYGLTGPYTTGSKCLLSNTSDAPSGFSRSIQFQSTKIPTTTNVNAEFGILQSIEGRDLERMGFGTSNINGLSISFWVKSSLTGTFMVSMAIITTIGDTIYNSEYSITQANTWQKIVIRIPNIPSSYTIPFDVNRRIVFKFPVFGYGTFVGTTNQWIAAPTAPFSKTTNSINLIETLNATINFTGLQIEVGAPTPFEYLPYEQQLGICQRYYQRITGPFQLGTASKNNSTASWLHLPLIKTMRSAPSFNISTAADIQIGKLDGSNQYSATAVSTNRMGNNTVSLVIAQGTADGTTGDACSIFMDNSAGWIDFWSDY